MKNFIIPFFMLFSGVLYAQDLTYNDNKSALGNNLGYNSEQTFVFNSALLVYKLNDELNAVNPYDIRRHELGEEVAKRIYLLEKTYTYESAAAPGSFSGKIIIEKPVIYSSIYKLEKAISKQVKKGVIEEDKASTELVEYLNIALQLFYENTAGFEEALKDADSFDDLSGVFKSVVFR